MQTAPPIEFVKFSKEPHKLIIHTVVHAKLGIKQGAGILRSVVCARVVFYFNPANKHLHTQISNVINR